MHKFISWKENLKQKSEIQINNNNVKEQNIKFSLRENKKKKNSDIQTKT